MKELGLVFACVDIVLTKKGEYVFLEANTGGQWGWVEDLTGMPITEAFAEYIIKRMSE